MVTVHLKEIFFLGLGLVTLTEIDIKKKKYKKKCKKMYRDGMPKSM